MSKYTIILSWSSAHTDIRGGSVGGSVGVTGMGELTEREYPATGP